MNPDTKTKRIVQLAVVAALYATFTLAIAPLSYGNIQFRLSEVMVLLAFFDPFYIGGLTLGCLIANFFSPTPVPDMIFGTLATFISVYAIHLTARATNRSKLGLIIASIWPTLFNGLIIGSMLHFIAELPLFLTIGQVSLGEFGVVSIIGVPLFLLIKDKYSQLLSSHK